MGLFCCLLPENDSRFRAFFLTTSLIRAPRRFSAGVFCFPGLADKAMDPNLVRKIENPGNPRAWKKIRWIPPALILGVVLVWELFTHWSGLPPFILPSPLAVAERLVRALGDGSLLRHTSVTLLEVLLGLLAGTISAIGVGYAIAKSAVFEQVASPFLVASQAVPIVAIAPLLMIWFGQGIFSKVLICGLIVFFPVLVNTVVGLRAVPRSLSELMYSLRASRAQLLFYLEIPAALPIFLGGLRIGATLAVIGAIVGEFVGADQGLGFLINVGRGQFDTGLVFVAVFTLIGLALSLYGLVILLEKKLLAWQEKI